ncbi:hypothetical protein MML48_4g00019824 [Holotrichia oblita]|uniref:Uncharacterized protein n=1 Tax=Holotrichia oblita TaxID=644536 RepID=A0ACB9TAP3_HOLOL|nr:hypothetical protein MML48_4g00019824 [Holotrichia oblita]
MLLFVDFKQAYDRIRRDTENGKVYQFEEVENFTYLGATFARKPGLEMEFQARLMSGNRSIAALNGMLRKRGVSSNPKQDAACKASDMGVQNLEENIWTVEGGRDMGEND